uniref:(northern house mosquito) hypothetical protein n=1 Tax=Culex pipiens TaxID=7175 RepID=A0A8D8HYG4_CULPI
MRQVLPNQGPAEDALRYAQRDTQVRLYDLSGDVQATAMSEDPHQGAHAGEGLCVFAVRQAVHSIVGPEATPVDARSGREWKALSVRVLLEEVPTEGLPEGSHSQAAPGEGRHDTDRRYGAGVAGR